MVGPLIGLRQEHGLLGDLLLAAQSTSLFGDSMSLQGSFQIRDLPLQLGRVPPFMGELTAQAGDLSIFVPLREGRGRFVLRGTLVQKYSTFQFTV